MNRNVALLMLAVAAAGATRPATRPGSFEFELKRDEALTSAGIYDAAGRLVRVLWTAEPSRAGKHVAHWDGLDDLGNAAPDGALAFRVVVNNSVYRNVGTIGNTGTPPAEKQQELHHIQHGVLSLAIDGKGNIHTANGWEEAGHDFKAMGPDGRTLFHARFQVRNGRPNGAPHAIAVDETHIYCATHGWASERWKSKQQIQRFRIADGTH